MQNDQIILTYWVAPGWGITLRVDGDPMIGPPSHQSRSIGSSFVKDCLALDLVLSIFMEIGLERLLSRGI
jgi:hypothetical protein